MSDNNLYIWACDSSEYTGEGNLGRLFIKKKLKKYNSIIINKYPKDTFFEHKYISPFVGVIMCWKYFFKKKNICYLNYLPLWNIFIFLFLPPKTILGPITGGAYFKKAITIEFFFRKYIFPVLYYLSSTILYIRDFNTLFSTSLLEKHIFKKLIKKAKFNFFISGINKISKKKFKKEFHFIIYYKKHKNKINMYPLDLIKKIIMFKYKILVVGDRMDLNGVINLGYLEKIKLENYLLKTKFFISSNENIANFFAIDCINNGVKIITNKKYNKINKLFDKNLFYLNHKTITKHKIEKLLCL